MLASDYCLYYLAKLLSVVDVDRRRGCPWWIGSPGRLVVPRGLIEGERPRETRAGVGNRGGDRVRSELLREKRSLA